MSISSRHWVQSPVTSSPTDPLKGEAVTMSRKCNLTPSMCHNAKISAMRDFPSSWARFAVSSPDQTSDHAHTGEGYY
ncbi:hypothetical protein J1614_001382 [Plenodomus biglobosus]|nr:hypothetical protein J1614_001382 [Plenodomus biglobosus]